MAIQNIAVGIDGSATATNAVAWAAGLARCEHATLQPIHVWQAPFVCTYPWSGPSVEEQVRHARILISDTLQTAGVDQTIESVIAQGAAGPVLAATSANADLLVVGRTGQNLVDYKPDFGGVIAGATARYCVNESPVPVATVPVGGSWRDAPQVLVGIDGSPTSLAALKWATEHLPQTATIHALHAVTWPTDNYPDADFGAELLDPTVDRHRHELQKMVDDNLSATFVAAGRTVHSHVVLGYAQDALTKPGFPCDLIVVGEHGDTAASPGVLGSVADHTWRYATVPIIVVPGPTTTASATP